MGRGRFSFSFILVLTLGAFLFLRPFASGREFRREWTCYSNTLHLDCGKLSLIAIHEAYFTTDHNRTCHPPDPPEHEYIDDEKLTLPNNYSVCHEDIRVSINRRCSGLKNCSFSYNSLPERECSNPEGLFVVQYDCFKDSSVHKYCNSKVTDSEGYITSPGFPIYYPRLGECSWTLSASEGQTLRAQLLQLHLRDSVEVPPPAPHPDEPLPSYAFPVRPAAEPERRCDEDRLSAVHGLDTLFTVCGEEASALKAVEVDAGLGIELRFKSEGFLPAPGFLLYFKVLGCPSPITNEGSYVLERNGSAAVVACRNHHVFNDTLEERRFLHCVRNHHWNDTLPPCITHEELTTAAMAPNNSIAGVVEHVVDKKNASVTHYDQKTDLVVDIIVPSVLMGALILGNIVIIIIIFIMRRRKRKSESEFEEIVEEPKSQPLVAEEEETDNV